MKKILSIFILWFILTGASAFAQNDVRVDGSGNIVTGASATGNLEVTGSSGEHGIVGITDGTGAAGVSGENTSFGNYGRLGYYNYGVYGYSLGDHAGYFQGNVRVTGNLTVDGTLSATLNETDPTVNALGQASLSCTINQVAKWNGDTWICDDDVDTDTTLTEGEVDAFVSNNGYLTSETDPQVGGNSVNFISKWDGSALVSGSIYDDGNVGIGTVTPSHTLDVRGGANTYLGYFLNNNSTSGQSAYGLYAGGNAFGTVSGTGLGGEFYAYGGSAGGEAFGTFNMARAYGSSNAYGVYSNATGGSTTGREWAFFGEGDGFFSGNVGIGTVTPSHTLDVRGGADTYIGYFVNDNNTNGQSAYGLYAESNAYDTLTGRGYGGLFYGYGGSTGGEAFGSFNLAEAYGTSTAYGVYSDATGGTTTGREWAFYGLGDGYFYGDVGIGTSNPSYKLDVRGSANAYLGYFLNDNNTSDEYAYGLYAEGNAFDTVSGKGYGGVFYGYGGSEGGVAIGTLNSAEAYGTSDAYGVYSNATGGTTTGREWAFYGLGDGYFSGTVGIGTVTPYNLLDLGSSVGKKLAVFQNSLGTDFYGFGISSDTLEFYAGVISTASPSMVLKKISGNVGIGTTNPGYRFHVVDSQDSMPIARFENTSVHPAADGIEIKIGPTSNPASNNVFISFRDGDGTVVGHVDGNGIGGVNYVAVSDARLKTKIDDFTGGLDMVSRMKVRKYEFIEAPGNQSIGFLAQELQTVFPQAVSGDPEDNVAEKPMGVDYGRVTPVLVSAIQELKAENEALKAEIREIKETLGL